MDIRGITLDQIEQALESANERYGGNLRLAGHLTRYPLEVPAIEHVTYRVRNWHTGELEEYAYDYERTADYDLPWIPDAEPLNGRGDAFKIRLQVISSKRPGSRVAPERYYFGPDVSTARRVASPCWHANRDFMRAVFDINPDARIRTALTNTDDFAADSEYYGYGRRRQYTGSDHFEEMYQSTDKNIGNRMSSTPHSDACNCEEGYYFEFATEGLTPEVHREHVTLLRDLARDAHIDTNGWRWQKLEASGDLEKMLRKVLRPTPAYLRLEV